MMENLIRNGEISLKISETFEFRRNSKKISKSVFADLCGISFEDYVHILQTNQLEI